MLNKIVSKIKSKDTEEKVDVYVRENNFYHQYFPTQCLHWNHTIDYKRTINSFSTDNISLYPKELNSDDTTQLDVLRAKSHVYDANNDSRIMLQIKNVVNYSLSNISLKGLSEFEQHNLYAGIREIFTHRSWFYWTVSHSRNGNGFIVDNVIQADDREDIIAIKQLMKIVNSNAQDAEKWFDSHSFIELWKALHPIFLSELLVAGYGMVEDIADNYHLDQNWLYQKYFIILHDIMKTDNIVDMPVQWIVKIAIKDLAQNVEE